MAQITISNLPLTGSDLFADSESFLNDLSESEIETKGGFTPVFFVAGVALGYAISKAT